MPDPDGPVRPAHLGYARLPRAYDAPALYSSLRERLDRNGPLQVAEALLIARQVARGLTTARARGIVHRDLKAANILLRDGNAVLADFGAAVVTSDAPVADDAPRPLDGRSDVYALGCLLYEMLVGRAPEAELGPARVMVSQLTAPISMLRRMRPDVPVSVERVLHRALAEDPAARFASAELFERGLASAFRSSDALPIAVERAG